MTVYARVRERDSNLCRGCSWGTEIEVHHILFRSQGGPDEEWNLISLCRECHIRAHGTHSKPRFPRWLLHLTVLAGQRMGVTLWAEFVKRRLHEMPDLQVCLSCDRYGDAGICQIWEEEFSWDYWCSAWKMREDD